MKKVLLLILIAMVFCACEKTSEKIEAQVQSLPKPTAQDIAADERKSDMTMPDLTKGGIRTVDIDAAREHLKSHPLFGLFKPENQRIVRYLGLHNLDYDCRPGHPDRVASCDQLVTAAIQKCKTAGISVTEADIKNPEFAGFVMASMQMWKDDAAARQGKQFLQFEDLCKKQLEKFKKGELQ